MRWLFVSSVSRNLILQNRQSGRPPAATGEALTRFQPTQVPHTHTSYALFISPQLSLRSSLLPINLLLDATRQYSPAKLTMPRQIFKNRVIAAAGPLPGQFTVDNLKQWTKQRRGRFQESFDEQVTHLLCTQEQFDTRVPIGMLRFASCTKMNNQDLTVCSQKCTQAPKRCPHSPLRLV